MRDGVPGPSGNSRLADDFGRGGGEIRDGQPAEEFRGAQAAVHVLHACSDILAELELMAALGDFDRANIAGPVVNVLE